MTEPDKADGIGGLQKPLYIHRFHFRKRFFRNPMGRIVEEKIDHGSHVNSLTHGFNQFRTTVLKDLLVLVEMFRRDKTGQLLIVGHFPELSPYRTGDGTRNQSQNNKKENTFTQHKTMSDLKILNNLFLRIRIREDPILYIRRGIASL